MTVAIGATVFGATPDRPTVELSVTGLTVGDVVNITRQASGEPPYRVRGAVDVVATSSTVIVLDTAPSLGRVLTYSVTVGGVFKASANVTVSTFTGNHLLTDVATGEGVPVQIIADTDSRTQAARYNALQPVGAAFPVVLYDTRSPDQGVLPVYTPDRATTLALRDLLAAGRPLVSRHRNDTCDIASIEYVYPLDVSRDRFTRNGARMWAFPFIAIDVPDPKNAVVLVTLQDIADYFPSGGTLLDIANRFGSLGTLLDIALDPWGVL